MSFAVPATPQRPTPPGAFINTPAPSRPPVFRAPSTTTSFQNVGQQQTQPSLAPTQQVALPAATSTAQTLTPIERAARTINETLTQETRYPDLDTYVGQGISSDYDTPTSTAWAPFQRVKTYDIPDRIFEQYNHGQMSTTMGLFAELNHAWITIDNQLYLWDYTHPNPELIGFEEQPNTITAVKLVVPRPKVFVDSISHLLVVATISDIYLIGVSCQRGPEGVHSVALYQTRMHVSIKGMKVSCVEGSAKTGRIFFGDGRDSDDIYEITYQQEEKWFANRCAKINHVSKPLTSTLLSTISFGQKIVHEHVVQMAIDDTRNLLYTLSSSSTIRVFHMKTVNTLDCVITRPLSSIKTMIGHMVRSELLGPNATLVSIDPISATESARLNLMATTSTGCRIFLSATSGTYYFSDSSSAPTSMQVHHVKFPPPEGHTSSQSPSSQLTTYQAAPPIATNSKMLMMTRKANRYAPGYFFCFVQRTQAGDNDLLFMSAPDSGRIARPQEPAQGFRYMELGHWLQLGGQMEDIGLVTPPFAAAPSPMGFGNELAVQFDQPGSEIAILTNTGVQTIRRRRLVDMFASAIRYGGGEEGLEAELRKFVRLYGRGETSATALAVACGQGSDVTPDARVAKITDHDILEYARKAFIEFGGKAQLNENSVVDNSASAIDNVRPSPRHEGIALYISRLVRSIWKLPILKEGGTPIGGLTVAPAVQLPKLQSIQRDLTHLQEFLDSNKSFIDGLAGPEALGRAATKQDEVELQGENRALTSLVRLIGSVIEGISFVLVLFDERVDEIVLSLSDTSRQRVRELTFEGLFCSPNGKELAKELVKAIVNRNIAKGSNVETIAEALRRRCGSFCSSEDVVIFKAQEQLKKASEAGANTESGRMLLNESLKLFEKVAASLSMEHLEWAVKQYVSMAFYAGAIRLALKVAQQLDRGNRALAWIKDGCPQQDVRRASFESRTKCYDLVHEVIRAVDKACSDKPDMVDGTLSLTARRRDEAYEEINNSDDEVFQTYLYDWYLSQGWSDRLLEISSPHVVTYLQRKSLDDAAHADLLWRYYAHYNSYFEAATVQLQLVKSGFELSLEQRIEYLSRARANASTRVTGISDMRMNRQSRQELLREVSDLLDLANIQEDILQRMKSDVRLQGERRDEVLKQLDGQILPLDELYNGYADQAGYYDICIQIYHAADYRNATDIRATWTNLVEQLHIEAIEQQHTQPWELVAENVRTLGRRLNCSETTFPIPTLLPLLLQYDITTSAERAREAGKTGEVVNAPQTWVLDIFLELHVPCESLVAVLETLYWSDEPPFAGRNKRIIAKHLIYVIEKWFEDTSRHGVVFGGEENTIAVADTLKEVLSGAALEEGGEWMERGRVLRATVESMLR